MKIAQAEGKEWKTEVHKYLVAYRSTPHTTTGVSPAELLFGRKMRTELPEQKEESTESEIRDRDGKMKAKTKWYADKKRNAHKSYLAPGDQVLVKQERKINYQHHLLLSLTMLSPRLETVLLLNHQTAFN